VATRLRQFIIRGRFSPGDALPSEHDLAERFGVSRPSIREAVMGLRQLGLLESAPRRGMTVGRLDAQRLGECLQVHAAINAYSLTQLARARAVIEIGTAPFIVDAMAKDVGLFDRLHALTEDPGLISDAKRYVLGDLAFHRALMAASGVAPIDFFDQLLGVFFQRFGPKAAGTIQDREQGIMLHRSMLKAYRAGDTVRAQELIRISFLHYEE